VLWRADCFGGAMTCSFLRLALFVSLLALGACDSIGTAPTFAESLCTDGIYAPFEGLALADPAPAYLEVVHEYADVSGEQVQGPRSGESCTQAPDPAACASAIEAARTTATRRLLSGTRGFEDDGRTQVPSYLLVERAGVVTVADTEERLAAVLGPIDTAKEAALLTYLREYDVACGGADASTAEADGTGWKLSVQYGSACGADNDREGNVVRVARDGSFELASTVLLERGDDNCQDD
jgi:hypothetical protein